MSFQVLKQTRNIKFVLTKKGLLIHFCFSMWENHNLLGAWVKSYVDSSKDVGSLNNVSFLGEAC